MTISSFKGRFAFLSNFYPAAVLLDGQKYPTVEHAYQAAKTLRPNERTLIRNMTAPGRAKAMGRQITLRKDWNDVKLGVMRQLLRAKFHKIDMRMLLLATGDEELVEENTWNDTYWGTCKGKGDNNLGKLLMEVRTGYRDGTYS